MQSDITAYSAGHPRLSLQHDHFCRIDFLPCYNALVMEREENAIWMLGMLEAVAHKLGIWIRYESLENREENLQLRSGFCRLKGRRIILVDRRLSPEKRCDIIANALKRLDLSDVYVPPAVRERLE
jgi:hypothetical protein